MKKSEKTERIADIVELLKGSSAVYVADYSGINVENISNVRNEFRKSGVKYKVIKNTLFERAIEEVGGYDHLKKHLVGMNGFAFASEDPVAPAKIIKKFNDVSQKLPLRACYIESQYFDGSKLSEIANLPTKSEIIAGILGSIDAPASGVVGAINAVMRDLVSVIDEISKKEAA
ncbi:MAG: 50S ribosomal protein L10 [Ignavibacteriaceae bacterium]|jgi:large subunit ribosomal protein L10|nr:50S ribosomal protein L10 [Ignavibacteriaceae bacterium]